MINCNVFAVIMNSLSRGRAGQFLLRVLRARDLADCVREAVNTSREAWFIASVSQTSVGFYLAANRLRLRV